MILLPHLTPSLLGRSLLAWAFVRVLVMVGSAAAAAALRLHPDPLRLVPSAALLVVAIVGVLGWVSARRRNEDLFAVSLGYGRAQLLATIVAPAVLLELILAIAVRR